jgi:hypothetical protein
MAWPTEAIITTAMDEATDDASQARAEIKKMADAINTMQTGRGQSDGVASLGAGGKVPVEQLPTVTPAVGGTGQTAYTVGDILIATGTGALSRLAAGSTGFVLTSNGPGVAPSWQLAGGGLTSGVRMLFQNTAAPTGWTKETNSAYNNIALRIVTGTVSSGGTDNFDAVFNDTKTTNSHALTIAQMPSHNHVATLYGTGFVNQVLPNPGYNYVSASRPNTSTGTAGVKPEGGGQGHSHAMTMDIKYRDFILAQKD